MTGNAGILITVLTLPLEWQDSKPCWGRWNGGIALWTPWLSMRCQGDPRVDRTEYQRREKASQKENLEVPRVPRIFSWALIRCTRENYPKLEKALSETMKAELAQHSQGVRNSYIYTPFCQTGKLKFKGHLQIPEGFEVKTSLSMTTSYGPP